MRERLASLTRKCRHANWYHSAFQWGMYLIGCTYNLCWNHSTLEQTPAMAAGLTDHAWSLREVLTGHQFPQTWRPRSKKMSCESWLLLFLFHACPSLLKASPLLLILLFFDLRNKKLDWAPSPLSAVLPRFQRKIPLARCHSSLLFCSYLFLFHAASATPGSLGSYIGFPDPNGGAYPILVVASRSPSQQHW